MRLKEGRKEIVELLIAVGADVNANQMEGWTLKYYGTTEKLQSVEQTPLDFAIKYHPETAGIIRKHGGKRGPLGREGFWDELLYDFGWKKRKNP